MVIVPTLLDTVARVEDLLAHLEVQALGNVDPHIHFALAGPGFERFVTQMYVAGESGNAHDPVLNGIRDEAARNSVIVALSPAPELEAAAARVA